MYHDYNKTPRFFMMMFGNVSDSLCKDGWFYIKSQRSGKEEDGGDEEKGIKGLIIGRPKYQLPLATSQPRNHPRLIHSRRTSINHHPK
jgi:hypothetical protein